MMMTGMSGWRWCRFAEIQPRTARHANVADDHLRHVMTQGAQCVVRRGEAFELDVLARQRFFQHPAYRAVIVNYPNGFHVHDFYSKR